MGVMVCRDGSTPIRIRLLWYFRVLAAEGARVATIVDAIDMRDKLNLMAMFLSAND